MRDGRHTGRRGRREERGAALLIVMVAVAILTALAAELAYDTQVRLRIAGGARDTLRAEALARSGVSMSRLVLAFQAQIDEASGKLCSAFGAAAGSVTGQPARASQGTQAAQAAQAQAQAQTGCPRPQIWNVIPVSSGLVQALFGGGGAPDAAPAEGGARAVATFGDFEGAFDAKITDEGNKVNLQLDALAVNGALTLQVESYLRLVCDARWDFLFDREDADGQKWSRQDLAVHLRDWNDEDKTASSLAVSFPGGGNCNFAISPTLPFEQGFRDENYPYDRGQDRYGAKNARLDSLDELYLVAGVSEVFMAAFGDQVTVYLPKEGGINVNTSTPEDEMRIARLMADPAALPLLADPTFPERLHTALSDARMGGLFTLTPVQFAQLVDALGVPVRPELLRPTQQKSSFTDRSVAYRIRSVGAAGDVEKRIDAVVTFDPSQNQDANAGKPLPGRLIRWREE